MVIAGFSNPFVSGFYLIAIGLLALHLSHGIASLFQTLGLTTAKLRPLFEIGGGDHGLGALRWICLDSARSSPRHSPLSPDRCLPLLRLSHQFHAMILDAKIPEGPIEKKWTNFKNTRQADQPGQQAEVQGHRRRLRPRRFLGRRHPCRTGYKVECFCFQDSARRAHSIAAQGASMPPRTTRTTATASGASSTTPSRGGTSAPARPMSIVLPRLAATSSTSVFRRGSLSPANMAENSPTAPSAALRFPAVLCPRPDRSAAPARVLSRPEQADRAWSA